MIIVTLPYFVWEDWKKRELNDTSMGALLCLNLPFLFWAYIFGGFGWEEIVVSVLPICIYYLLTRFANAYFHGDDFIYMSIVSLCLVVNPMHPFSSAIPVKILIYMVGVIVFVAAINLWVNIIRQIRTGQSEYIPGGIMANIIHMANRFDGGFPMMFVFAPTIILALVI